MVNLVFITRNASMASQLVELAVKFGNNSKSQMIIAAGKDSSDKLARHDPVYLANVIDSLSHADHILVTGDSDDALMWARVAVSLLEWSVASKVRLCAPLLIENTLAAFASASAGAAIEQVMKIALAAAPSGQDLNATSTSMIERAGSLFPSENTLTVPSHYMDISTPPSPLIVNKKGRMPIQQEKGVTCAQINYAALREVINSGSRRINAQPYPEGAEGRSELSAKVTHDIPPIYAQPWESEHLTGNAESFSTPEFELDFCGKQTGKHEINLLRQAIDLALADLSYLTAIADEKYTADIAAIFFSQHTLLGDAELYDAACEIMDKDQCGAAWAWHKLLSKMSQQFRHMKHDYLKARHIDIDDIRDQTLRHLLGVAEPLPIFNANTIIIANDIKPSTLIKMDLTMISGICLRKGSPWSHSAKIAREAGIAFFVQQGHLLDNIKRGEHVTLDLTLQRLILP